MPLFTGGFGAGTNARAETRAQSRRRPKTERLHNSAFYPSSPPLRKINSQQNFVTDLCVMLCFFM